MLAVKISVELGLSGAFCWAIGGLFLTIWVIIYGSPFWNCDMSVERNHTRRPPNDLTRSSMFHLIEVSAW